MTDEERASAYVLGTLICQRARPVPAAHCRGYWLCRTGYGLGKPAGAAGTGCGEAVIPDHLLEFDRGPDRSVRGGITRYFDPPCRSGRLDRRVPLGLKIKIMNRVEALNRQTFMAWLQPGAEYSDHDHDQDEEMDDPGRSHHRRTGVEDRRLPHCAGRTPPSGASHEDRLPLPHLTGDQPAIAHGRRQVVGVSRSLQRW